MIGAMHRSATPSPVVAIAAVVWLLIDLARAWTFRPPACGGDPGTAGLSHHRAGSGHALVGGEGEKVDVLLRHRDLEERRAGLGVVHLGTG